MGKLFPAFLSKKRDRSSHFLLSLLHSRQICNDCCTRTPAFAEATAVKARIFTQLKSCTLTNLWLRDSLYRDTAPVPAANFVTGDKFAAPIKIVPPLLICKSGAGATRVMLNKICSWPSFAKASEAKDGKKCAPACASLLRGRLPLLAP